MVHIPRDAIFFVKARRSGTAIASDYGLIVSNVAVPAAIGSSFH
jgi:hypothetical protein